MKNKNFITLCIALMLVFIFQIVAYATNTWSSKGTFELDSGDIGNWSQQTITGEKLGDTKESDAIEDAIVTVYTVSKSMTSYPKFKLVNSNNAERSEKIKTADTGRQATGESQAVVGHKYFASVAPAWNQITDNKTIRIQFDSY